MEETFIMGVLNNFGFPVVVTMVLLWDKFKTNGSLKKAVENNTMALVKLMDKMKC